jgi:hypothetical protein
VFFGMLMVDAALAAWALGIMQQPSAPRWIRLVLVWLGLTMAASTVLVLIAGENISLEKTAALIGPGGAGLAVLALAVATVIERRGRKRK